MNRILNLYTNNIVINNKNLFLKKLLFLLSSGIDINESLKIIFNETKNVYLKKVIGQIITDLNSGKFLAEILKDNFLKNDFFSINMIHLGELSGRLTDNLYYLENEMENRKKIKQIIIESITYPTIIFLVTIFVSVFILTYLFPKITPVFKSINSDLPFSTKLSISISTVLIKHYILIILSALFMFFCFYFLYKNNNKIRKIISLIQINTPIIGKMIKNYNLSKISRNLGILMKSGFDLNKSFVVINKIVENELYQNSLLKVRDNLNDGTDISTSLKIEANLFPNSFIEIVNIGEKTGKLDDTFLYLSRHYENEFNNQTKKLTRLIEPLLMIVMGLFVGFLTLSVITPIYKISQNIHG